MIWLFLLLINLHFKKIMTTYLNASVSSISVLDLKSLYENLDNYIKFDLTQDKFAFFEKFNSGSNFREGWKKGLEFLIKRQKDLHQEFLENEKAGYGYGTSYNVCKSYWDENFLAYETTRGTVIILGFEDTNKYYVLLPKNRMGGTHHKHLILALAGMTADIWEKETIEGDFLSKPYYNGEIPLWMESDFNFYSEKFQYKKSDKLEDIAEEFSQKVYAERL